MITWYYTPGEHEIYRICGGWTTHYTMIEFSATHEFMVPLSRIKDVYPHCHEVPDSVVLLRGLTID